MVLQEVTTLKGKSLNFGAIYHEIALAYLNKFLKPDYTFNAKDFLKLHELVLRSIKDDFAGRLRNSGVSIAGTNVVPLKAQKVYGLFDELVNFVNENPQQLNIIELVMVFHHKFVSIHPFFEGNIRTVRSAMNLILMNAHILRPKRVIIQN